MTLTYIVWHSYQSFVDYEFHILGYHSLFWGDYFGYIVWLIHDLFLIGEFSDLFTCYGYEYLDFVVEVVIASSVGVNLF